MTATAFDVISRVDETVAATAGFAGQAEVDARVARAWDSGNLSVNYVFISRKE
jgi:hypothetical protein